MAEGNTTEVWYLWNYTNVVKLTFFILVALIILLLNGAVMAVIICRGHLRTATNYFLFSLSVADVLVAVLTIPGHLLGEFEVFGQNEFACVLINSPTLTLPCAALLSLIAASTERFIALMYPLRYPSLVNSKRILLVISLIWIYSVMLGVLPVAGVNNIAERARMNVTLPACNFLRVTPGKYVGFVTFSTYVPGMILLAYVNFRVFRMAYRQRRLVEAQFRHVQGTRLPEHRRKVVVFVLFIIGHIYSVSHLPLLLTLLVDYRLYEIDLVIDVQVPFGVYVLTSCLVGLCPIAYPLVMAFGNRDIRAAIFSLCNRKRNLRNVEMSLNTIVDKECDKTEVIVIAQTELSIAN